jgi:hypothetical protein
LYLGRISFGVPLDDRDGEHFEAEFVRVEGANGIFIVKEKEYPYPLSVPDRLLVGRSVNQRAGPNPTAFSD